MTADLAAVLDYARALELIDIGDREEVRAAGASLFVRRREEIEPYDRAFTRFWRRRLRLAESAVPPPPTPPDEGPDGHSGGEAETSQIAESEAETSGEAPDGAPALTISPDSWSAAESMRHKSFERMTAAELREAERVIDKMRPVLPLRRTRRWELDTRGPLLAPREMLRRNLSAGGDLVEWVWRRPRKRPRNVVLV